MSNTVLLSLAIGLIVANISPLSPIYTIAMASIVGLIMVAVWPRYRWGIVAGLGLLVIMSSLPASTPSLAAERFNSPQTLRGYVVDLPSQNFRRQAFIFQVTQGLGCPHDCGLLRLTWYQTKQTIRIGEHWQFTLKLKPFSAQNSPGAFDAKRWADHQQFMAQGQVQSGQPLSGLTRPFYQHWRSLIRQSIQNHLPYSSYQGLVQGLAIGQRDQISDGQWYILRQTGTSHLLAISGLHVGLLAGLIFMLVNRLVRLWSWWLARWPSEWPAAWFAMVASTLYALLAGWSIPTQRATVMITLALLAVCWRRSWQGLRIWLVALVIVLILQQGQPLAVSFWLSFAAVALIFYRLHHHYPSLPPWRLWLGLQLALTLGIMPWSGYFFGYVSWVGLFANWVAIPWVSVVTVPSVLLGDGFSLLGLTELAGYCWQLAAGSLAGLMAFLSWLAHWPYATMAYSLKLWSLLGTVFASLWLLAPSGWPMRWLALPLLLLPGLISSSILPSQTVQLTLLPVRHGLSVVVRTRQHNLLYDTGNRAGFQYLVAPYLRNAGILSLDKVILSHNDSSHMGGLAQLKQQFTVREWLTPAPAWFAIPSQPCLQGQQWQWNQVTFTILAPNTTDHKATNHYSCVLAIDVGDQRILLTGDIGIRQQKTLAAQKSWPPVTLLVVPNQRRDKNVAPAFIQAMQPQWLLFSESKNWPLHPQWQGYRYLSTEDKGTLQLTLDGKHIRGDHYQEGQWHALSLQRQLPSPAAPAQ